MRAAGGIGILLLPSGLCGTDNDYWVIVTLLHLRTLRWWRTIKEVALTSEDTTSKSTTKVLAPHTFHLHPYPLTLQQLHHGLGPTGHAYTEVE